MNDMIDETLAKKLAEDIIDINCISCDEFKKPLNESCCWCDALHDIIDLELDHIYPKWDPEDEDMVAYFWEEIRNECMRDE